MIYLPYLYIAFFQCYKMMCGRRIRVAVCVILTTLGLTVRAASPGGVSVLTPTSINVYSVATAHSVAFVSIQITLSISLVANSYHGAGVTDSTRLNHLI